MSRLRSLAAAACAFGAVTALAGTSSAQQYVPSAVFQGASGMEGGGGREASLTRAPTRLRVGADVHVDEEPENALGIAGVIDLEPRARFGADIRYVRVVEQRFALNVGAIGFITPGTAIGPTAGLDYRHPVAKSLWLTAGPEVNVFVVGIDVPDKTVIWQALLHLGLRVDL